MSTEAQKRASTNYNRKQDNIMVRPNKEEGAAIRAAAAAAGQSVQGYILQAVRERMEREQSPGHTQRSTGTPKKDEYTGPGSAKWWAERAPQEATEGPGRFPYFPDDEDTPHAVVGTSPTQGEESSSADRGATNGNFG